VLDKQLTLNMSVENSGIFVNSMHYVCRAGSRLYILRRITVISASGDFSSTKVRTSTTRPGYVQHLASALCPEVWERETCSKKFKNNSATEEVSK